MNYKAYSIRDSKVGTYHPPFYAQTHGEAERMFKTTAKDPATQLAQFPEDFDLFFIGTYDTNSGKLTPVDSPQHMIKAVDILAQKTSTLDA